MTRVLVNEELCQGSGQCVALAPETLGLDEMGVAAVWINAPELTLDEAENLVRVCPAMAIELESPEG